ncbi:MAG TPA: methyltransferase domain-containing protein [Flavobacteriales bacterium]|nr:methyltransferase domain-containing protein [Flavobacteriales bacterium]
MKTPNAIKQTVRAKYAEIAQQDRADNAASCCGSGGCSTEVYNIMTDDYSKLEGHVDEADLGLGCGLPTQFAGIKPGDTVLDLGSGAGNDCFVARHEAGPDGRVIGVDFTPEMIAKARANAQQLGYANVEFREGDIHRDETQPQNAKSVTNRWHGDVLLAHPLRGVCVVRVAIARRLVSTMHRHLPATRIGHRPYPAAPVNSLGRAPVSRLL